MRRTSDRADLNLRRGDTGKTIERLNTMSFGA